MTNNRRGSALSYRYSLTAGSGRPRCPVCHKEVYSRSGIHPQCAVVRQDAAETQIRKAAQAAVAAVAVAAVE